MSTALSLRTFSGSGPCERIDLRSVPLKVGKVGGSFSMKTTKILVLEKALLKIIDLQAHLDFAIKEHQLFEPWESSIILAKLQTMHDVLKMSLRRRERSEKKK